MSSGMGLSLPLGKKHEDESKFDDMKALQEAMIHVEFLLPDDSTIAHNFKKGHTVQVLKSFLEEELDFLQADVKLYLHDKLMLDPFSLTDFDEVETAQSIQISVRVEHHGSGARK